ncbi:MAG: hypothetical protein KBC84_03825 [Proteobacteria bacterium]|nr:hypothetical protein [Pseudomonadota bacterium]
MIRILFIVLFLPITAFAQNTNFKTAHGDFFKLYFSDRSELQLQYLLGLNQKDSNGPGKFNLNYFTAKGEIPLPQGRDTYFRFGADYGARFYNFKNSAGALSDLDSETFHRIQGSYGIGQFINDDFLLTGIAKLGLFSNLHGNPEQDDFRINGDVIAVWRMNPGTQLVGGLAKANDFADTDYYPILGIRLLTEDGKFRISVTIPREARLDYNITSSSTIYGLLSLSGEKYNLYFSDPDRKVSTFIQDKHLGLGADHWFSTHIGVGLEAGLTIDAKTDLKLDGQNYLGNLENSAYALAQIKISL